MARGGRRLANHHASEAGLGGEPILRDNARALGGPRSHPGSQLAGSFCSSPILAACCPAHRGKFRTTIKPTDFSSGRASHDPPTTDASEAGLGGEPIFGKTAES